MREFISSLNLPISDPIWIFFIVMVIILFAPMLMGKLRIPHIIGMILAGIIIGEHGLNILEKDSSFDLFGQVGLFYIMFLASLEMDLDNFRKNKKKAIIFGLLTFAVPLILGILSSIYVLKFSFASSLLLASIYGSHTLLSYPIVSRYGLSHQRSVPITIGGTAVAIALSLLVLATVGGMFQGGTSVMFWITMGIKVAVIVLLICLLLPRIASWFFKKYDDAVSHYIFVLAMLFLGGGLMKLAGMEGILGAFLVGLVLNPLIPKVSPLMNRIEFVGNAIFIPYFLIGVGMIIDIGALFTSWGAWKVAGVMTLVAAFSKWLAAFITQKIYKMSGTERLMMFGLSNAKAVVTLTVALLGYNIILDNGERLFNEDVLNGAIVMILFACTISSIATERAAKKFKVEESKAVTTSDSERETRVDRILIPVANPDTIEGLMQLALLLKPKDSTSALLTLSVTTDGQEARSGMEQGRKLLEKAAKVASAVDVKVRQISRYDINVPSGITHTIKEYDATDLVMGLHRKSGFMDSFFGNFTYNILKGTGREVIVSRMMIPVNTFKSMTVVVPALAEYEIGFGHWMSQLSWMSSQLDCTIRFIAEDDTADRIEEFCGVSGENSRIRVERREKLGFADRMNFHVPQDELLVVISARSNTLSYDYDFERLPSILNHNFADASVMIIYPEQVEPDTVGSLSNPRI